MSQVGETSKNTTENSTNRQTDKDVDQKMEYDSDSDSNASSSSTSTDLGFEDEHIRIKKIKTAAWFKRGAGHGRVIVDYCSL